MSERLRHISALLLALALAVGLVTHGVQASDIGAKMVMTAAADMPMSGKCDGCGDDQKAMAAGACSGYCGSFVALPVAVAVFDAAPAKTLGHSVGPNPTGHTVPPDPYPPRPTVLS